MKTVFIQLLLLFLYISTQNIYCIEPVDDEKAAISSPELKITIQLPATEVKNQNATSTCWSFSTISLLESELLRTQVKTYDLSEMFIVRKVYCEKAERYIRMHGNTTFAGGGEPNDVLNAIKKYGIVPEQAYSGLLKDSLKHSHAALDNALKNYVEAIVSSADKKLEQDWKIDFNSILDTYLGKAPETFFYEGKEYTPKTFAATLNLSTDDYILLTSFVSEPMYKPFILEVPDNWSWGEVYNVSLNDIVNLIDSSLNKGFTIVWSADYSEPGFNYSAGLVVAPKIIYGADSKIDQKKLQKFSSKDKEELFFDLKRPVEEIEVKPENRQIAFDNYSTTDDHGMHIIGKAVGTDGKNYYIVKNSWGTGNVYHGYLYVSEAYLKYKTISLMVNKTVVPKDIKVKLSL